MVYLSTRAMMYTSPQWPRGFNTLPLKIQYLSTLRRQMSRVASFRCEPSFLRYEFVNTVEWLPAVSASVFLLSIVTCRFILWAVSRWAPFRGNPLEFKALHFLHRGKYITLYIVISPNVVDKITWLTWTFPWRIVLKNIAYVYYLEDKI